MTFAIAFGWSLPAAAAPSWKAPLTVTPVRGIPEPQVGIDASGRAVIAYANVPTSGAAGVYLTTRLPGAKISTPAYVGPGEEPGVAVAPDGRMAIVSRFGGRVDLLVEPEVGPPGSPNAVRRSFGSVTGRVDDPRVGIDGRGVVTLAWQTPSEGSGQNGPQIHVATVAPDGSTAGPQTLGPVQQCSRLTLEVNQAGDAALACFASTVVYVRAAGGEFQAAPFADAPSMGVWELALDGAGSVTALLEYDDVKSTGSAIYSTRPRSGSFGPLRGLAPGATQASEVAVVGQESRTVATWVEGGRLAYAIRPAGGEFAVARRAGVALATPLETSIVAPVGALPLISRPPLVPARPNPALTAVSIGGDGVPRVLDRRLVPGILDFGMRIAASAGGIAVAVWEQRCGDGFAVMAMALDERRGSSDPPCQDRRAPKALVRPMQARLAGRRLRVRIGCDEACRLGVRVRVLRGSSGRPLATGTLRTVSIGAARYRRLTVRLKPGQAAGVRRVLAAGAGVTVRLALPVRDGYGNGTVRRVAVPLRR